MIICAQPFFNELDLLEIKCRELADVVDTFVIVEARTTFTGKPKPLYFRENAGRFTEWPILHTVIDLPAEVPSPWDREWWTHKHLRNLVRTLAKRGDTVIWCDTDECPRADVPDRFEAMGVPAAAVDMDRLLYFFDRVDPRWPAGAANKTTARICRYDPAEAWGPWRGDGLGERGIFIPDGGWHFEYFGGKRVLLEKLAATSHSVEDPFQSMAREVDQGARPGVEVATAYPVEKLPAFVRANVGRFAEHFAK